MQEQVVKMDQASQTEIQNTKNDDKVENDSGSCPQSHSLIKHSLDQSFHRHVSRENGKEILVYRSNGHAIRALDAINEMQKINMLSDVILVTDDGLEMPAHKMILIACSPYFYMMFKNVGEREENRIVLNGIHRDILKLLLDFMYSTKIHITECNVQSLLAAANLLQLTVVVNACSDFLLRHLHPSNCFQIREFVNQNNCLDLLAQIDGYIEYNFSEIIKYEEFLSLSAQQLVKLISNDHLTLSSEEIVFECVISWINHNRKEREKYCTQLIEQVRLPLMSATYLLERVWEEKLVKADSQSKDYLIEALKYQSCRRRGESVFETQRTKPREPRGLQKLLVVIGGNHPKAAKSVECFDFQTKTWYRASDLPTDFRSGGITVLEGNIYAVGGCSLTGTPVKNMNVYDASADQWSACPEMNLPRKNLSVATLGNCIYAIGGSSGQTIYSSVEVYDPTTTHRWTIITPMPTARCSSAVGVVNNRLYVIGGYKETQKNTLASVLCYDPQTVKWTDVGNLATGRKNAGAGVLNGILYVVGGRNGEIMKSVEAFDPKINEWRKVKDMPEARERVAVIGSGKHLYVVGGYDGEKCLASVNVYSPENDTWEVLPSSMTIGRDYAGVAVINKPHDYI